MTVSKPQTVRRPRGILASAAFVLCALAAMFWSAPAHANGVDRIDGFSTWSPGDPVSSSRGSSSSGSSGSSAGSGYYFERLSDGSRGRKRRIKRARHASTIVDQSVAREGNGIYRTIRKAIDHTRPGGSVLIRAGRYPEHLHLTWPVYLRADTRFGAGKDDDRVLVEPPEGKSCVKVDLARDEALEIRGLAFALAETTSNRTCIEHKSGTMVLQDSEVSGNDRVPAITLRGPSAQLDNNMITSSLIGVYVMPGSAFSTRRRDYVLNGNEIVGNVTGVNVDGYDVDVTLEANRILRSAGSGLVVQKGRVSGQMNYILRNMRDGVVVLYPEQVDLTGNVIFANERFGLYAPMTPSGTFRKNTVACNAVAAIRDQSLDDDATDEDANDAYPGNIFDFNPPIVERRGRLRRFFGAQGRVEDYREECADYLETVMLPL